MWIDSRATALFTLLASVSIIGISGPAFASDQNIGQSIQAILNAQAFDDGGSLSASYPSSKLLPAIHLSPSLKETLSTTTREARIRGAHREIADEIYSFISGLRTSGPKEACENVYSFMTARKGVNGAIKPSYANREFDIDEMKTKGSNRAYVIAKNEDHYASVFRIGLFIPKTVDTTVDDIFELVMDWDQGPISVSKSVGWFYNYEDAENPSCKRELRNPRELGFGPLYEDDEVRAIKKCFYLPDLHSTAAQLANGVASLFGTSTDYLYCNLNIYRRKTLDEGVYLFTASLFDTTQSDCRETEHQQELIQRGIGYSGVYLIMETEDYYAVYNKGIQTIPAKMPPPFSVNETIKGHHEEMASLIRYLVKQGDIDTVQTCKDFQ